MVDEDRRSLLRTLTDEQYKDLVKVLAGFPQLSLVITTEVVDDETQHVVTAGSIVTVTIKVTRKGLDKHLGSLGFGEEEDVDDDEKDGDMNEENIDDEEDENLDKEPEDKEEDKKKGPVWKKPQQKKKAKKTGKQGPKPKPKTKSKTEVTPATPSGDQKEGVAESGSESEGEESDERSEESSSEAGAVREKQTASGDDDNEEEEWARFQKGMNRREKALAGKSRVSHSVHCPYFTDDKQEFWWVYISDRKTHSLITPPYHLTVCVRSDSYLGVDLLEDIKLDVQKAWEAPK